MTVTSGIGVDNSPPSVSEFVGCASITITDFWKNITGVTAGHGLDVTEIESQFAGDISLTLPDVPCGPTLLHKEHKVSSQGKVTDH